MKSIYASVLYATVSETKTTSRRTKGKNEYPLKDLKMMHCWLHEKCIEDRVERWCSYVPSNRIQGSFKGVRRTTSTEVKLKQVLSHIQIATSLTYSGHCSFLFRVTVVEYKQFSDLIDDDSTTDVMQTLFSFMKASLPVATRKIPEDRIIWTSWSNSVNVLHKFNKNRHKRQRELIDIFLPH